MGAISFYVTGEGKNEREAFEKLVDQAIADYGADAYNGTISTTELVESPIVIAKVYSDQSEQTGRAYAKREDYGEKWAWPGIRSTIRQHPLPPWKQWKPHFLR